MCCHSWASQVLLAYSVNSRNKWEGWTMVLRHPMPLKPVPILEGPQGSIMHHSFFLFISDFLKSGFQGVLVLAYRRYFSYLNKNSLDAAFFFFWWGVTRRKVAKNMPFSPSKCFSNWNNHGLEAKICDGERVFSGKVNLIGECHKEDEISVGAQLCSELITDGNLLFWQRNLQSAVVLYCNGRSSCSQHSSVGCLLLKPQNPGFFHLQPCELGWSHSPGFGWCPAQLPGW